MLAAINGIRSEAGRGPVADCANLDRAAQGYADVMSSQDWFDHTGPDGSTMSSRVEATGYGDNVALGENIAKGHPDVAAVMQGWLESPGHRENILGDYTHVGLGRTEASWVQDFGADGNC
jgi:uncharacterized protein YkwD